MTLPDTDSSMNNRLRPRFLLPWLVAALAAAVGISMPAAAQLGGSSSKVRVSITSQKVAAAPGDQFALAVVLDHSDGWHTQTNDPKVPDALKDLAPLPTIITIDAPRGVKLGPVQWPKSKLFEVGFFGDPIKMEFVSGNAIAFVPVQI
ncbi:MAG: hypothetical protein ACK58T_39610, partial [Phycisphaerae bacterium]